VRVRFGDDGLKPKYSYANQKLARMSESVKDQNTKAREEARDDSESWPEWHSLSPLEHWHVSAKWWQFYLEAGGSLDPEPDSQSPFNDVMPHGTAPA
jgi:hypothetical protein